MLRKLRVVLAAFCLAGFCLLFLDVSGYFPRKLDLFAKVQFIPAFLAGSFAVVVALLALALIFGRVYCSIVCPLGILQDMLSQTGRKNRFNFSQGRPRLRAVSLFVFILALLTGVPLIFAILEPYSAFGRIATSLLTPVWQAGNNLLALGSERAGNFAVGAVPVWQKGVSALVAAGFTLGILGFLSWKSGRIWCNTLCPVGGILGFVSRFAFFRFRIDATKCLRCNACVKICKASCIDVEKAAVDGYRCVACFNCLYKCRNGAIAYAPIWRDMASSAPNLTRRNLVVAGLSILGFPGFAAAARRSSEEKEPDLSRKKRLIRETPVIPPGSVSLQRFRERCTGCQLCVSACPNQVLCAFDHGAGMLQTALSFERGYCRVNCVVCSQICPTDAIKPITAAEKSAIQIGRAGFDRQHCIITTDKVTCLACSRACPTGAIILVDGKDDRKEPSIDPERCTGCGACEYVCPVRSISAVQVEGNLVHRRI